jgi:hypothetical protein
MRARFLAAELRRIARKHGHSMWWVGKDGVRYLIDIRFLGWTIARVSDEDDPAAFGGTTRVAEMYVAVLPGLGVETKMMGTTVSSAGHAAWDRPPRPRFWQVQQYARTATGSRPATRHEVGQLAAELAAARPADFPEQNPLGRRGRATPPAPTPRRNKLPGRNRGPGPAPPMT